MIIKGRTEVGIQLKVDIQRAYILAVILGKDDRQNKSQQTTHYKYHRRPRQKAAK
jgi:hypothetical protein